MNRPSDQSHLRSKPLEEEFNSRHPDRCGFSELSDYEASRTIPGTRNAAVCQERAVFVGR
jgi:hypothetical protein